MEWNKPSLDEMRDFAKAALEKRFGKVDFVTGRGIQRGTRAEFVKDGKKVACAIKAATGPHGRIHFAFENGKWGTLSEVDFVLYVRANPNDSTEFVAQFYEQAPILEAFEANRRSAIANGSENLPPWLSSIHEPELRFVGSGFEEHALWKDSSRSASTLPAAPTPPAPAKVAPAHPVKAAIDAAKDKLARELGVSTAAIEITIRWA